MHAVISSRSLMAGPDNPGDRWDVPFIMLVSRLAALDETVTRADWEKALAGQNSREKIATLNAARNVYEIKAALLAGLALKTPSAPVDLACYSLACRIANERAAKLRDDAAAMVRCAGELEEVR